MLQRRAMIRKGSRGDMPALPPVGYFPSCEGASRPRRARRRAFCKNIVCFIHG
jgi:hypothetical protein